MSAKQNILESREYPINELTDKQKRSKRGLLK